MTVTTSPAASSGAIALRQTLFRWALRHSWPIGVWALLLVLVTWYATLIPRFGGFQITSITKNSLPLALLAIGQAVIVISGGIDLGVGAMMVLGNSVAAVYMEGQPFAVTLLIGFAVVVGMAAVNGGVGWVINTSGVPDIVVTLATLFIYGGVALLVLPGPGGGTSERFRYLFTGSTTGVGTNYWPPVAVLIVTTGTVAWFMRRTRTGLSLYATGSDPNAAYLSGVDTARAKIIAYAVGGGLSGLAGLAVLALTNVGDPRLSIGSQATLQSVAAVVIGGIALTGGIGSVVGAAAAGIIVFFLDLLLVAIGFDPNAAQIVQGVLIVAVMMVAGLLDMRRRQLE